MLLPDLGAHSLRPGTVAGPLASLCDLRCPQPPRQPSQPLAGLYCEGLGRNGPAQGSINIVLVPSNFNGDMDLFRAKSDELYAEFQRHTPIAADGGLVNVWRVMQEATGYGPAQPSSYCGFYGMGTRMDCERCLYCDTTKAKTLAAYCDFGFASTVIVLHNSDIYGGVGYTEEGVGTVSTARLAGLIAVHELGHSLFRLGDEYTYGL